MDTNNFTVAESIKIKALKNREIYIYGVVTEDTELVVNKMLDLLAKKDCKKPIYLKISSEGGSMYAMFSIVSKIEELKAKGIEVIGISYGLCMSAGAFIFMACSKRISQKHTRFLIHEPLTFSGGESLSVENTKRMYKDMESSWQRIKEITKRNTKVNDELLDKISNNDLDYFMWPEEAKCLGIVDEILGE